MLSKRTLLACLALALLLTTGCGGKPEKVARCIERAKEYHLQGEYDRAIEALDEAIELDPECAAAYHRRGSARTFQGEFDKAIADYTKAMRLAPRYAGSLYKLGFGCFKLGEYDSAITAYDEAIRIDSDRADASAYYYRGLARDRTGAYEQAIADYREASRRDPEFPKPYFSLSQLLSSCPEAEYRDGPQAVENAEKAFELEDSQTWHHHGTLAAAYAEAGDFEKAVASQAKAIELVGQTESVADSERQLARRCLELYNSGKPFRRKP